MGLFGKPSRNKFAQMVMDGIRRAGEAKAIQYDPDEFCLSEEGRGTLNLYNGYVEYCGASNKGRQKVLQRWVRAWFALARKTPEEFEEVRPDLLPAVRGRSYFDIIQLRTQVSGYPESRRPYQPVGEHLAAGLVYDMPEMLRFILQDDLDTWGVTFYEAMEVAKENLKQLPQRFIGPEKGSGVYLSANGDNLDASRLLLVDLIRQFNLDGDPIAMAPTRDTMVVAGADDFEALKGLLALARDAVEKQPRFVSTVAVRLDGDEWKPGMTVAAG